MTTIETAEFRTLWESYTGEACETIAVMFSGAADLLEAEGYDRYSREEDETSTGITLYEALERVARQHVSLSVARSFPGSPSPDKIVEADTKALQEELETRLAAVLYVTGQKAYDTREGLQGALYEWLREPASFRGPVGRQTFLYRGKAHVIRLLRVAAVMTITTENL